MPARHTSPSAAAPDAGVVVACGASRGGSGGGPGGPEAGLSVVGGARTVDGRSDVAVGGASGAVVDGGDGAAVLDCWLEQLVTRRSASTVAGDRANIAARLARTLAALGRAPDGGGGRLTLPAAHGIVKVWTSPGKHGTRLL